MEEINAWGAYESGTTQNARSLGNTVRRRRGNSVGVAPVDQPQGQQPQKSSHAVFFGTDDIISTLKTNAAAQAAEEAEGTTKKEEPQRSEEWSKLSDLAHEIFQVYFSSDNDSKTDADLAKLKQVKKGIHTKINGTMPYLTGYLKKMPLPGVILETLLFTEASFRGIAQVYFQNNPLSGLLILAGMFVQSTRVAVHGIVAIVAGNLAGVLMGFDKSFLSCGLFGYNSFLVGLALATFYSPEKHEGYYWPVLIGTVIFAYFSSVLFVMLGKILSPYKTPPFTLPFNIATIFFLLAMGGMHNVDMAPVRQPQLPSYDVEPVSALTAKAFFAGSIRGVGQVFLANDLVASLLVLAGIMVCSRISAIAALIGSAVGAGVAALVGCSRDAIENGMYGFNSSLTLTAMLMFYVPSIGSLTIGIIASMITVFIQLALAIALEPCGLPYMTLPFCIAALAYIVIQGTTSNVISVPLSSMTTPEDHLKRVMRLSNGFDLLYGAIQSSSYKGGRKKLAPRSFVSTKMMTSLNEYDDAVHGDTKKEGFFSLLCQCFKKDTHEGKDMNMRSSFRMSFAMRNPNYGDEEKNAYAKLFRAIDTENEYEISKEKFKEFLRSVGLSDETGLDFACEAFQLLDLDKSGDIDEDEFIAFCQISKHMPEIQRMIVKFFDFADINGDGSIEISELDCARSYLGLPPLSDADHDSLLALCNEDDELEFAFIVNFVTIFKLKTMIKEYQAKREKGFSPDESVRSSLSAGGKDRRSLMMMGKP